MSRHRLAITVWIAVVPTLMVLQPLLAGPLKGAPQPVRTLVTTTIAIPIVVYVLMPALLRITSPTAAPGSRPSAGGSPARSSSNRDDPLRRPPVR